MSENLATMCGRTVCLTAIMKLMYKKEHMRYFYLKNIDVKYVFQRSLISSGKLHFALRTHRVLRLKGKFGKTSTEPSIRSAKIKNHLKYRIMSNESSYKNKNISDRVSIIIYCSFLG